MNSNFFQSEAACRPRWMLVDDNEDVLFLMREIVSRFSDAEIECFNSPQSALAAFAASPERFELVITDFEMPGMNGVEFCHRLLAHEPSAKIILATGSGLISKEAALTEGFCGLLLKPFSFAELRRALENIGLEKVAGNSSTRGAALVAA